MEQMAREMVKKEDFQTDMENMRDRLYGDLDQQVNQLTN